MQNNGFITLHRKVMDNPIWQNPNLAHVFTTLLLLATHERDRFLWNGKEEKLERGQLITGRKSLARLTGIPEGSLPRLLTTLETLGILNIKSNTKFSVITLLNYSKYQSKKVVPNSELNNRRTTDEQQTNTLNNDNNVNNDNKIQALWLKFETNPLMQTIKQKFPDRDYKFYFDEMCDWWLANKRKLPKAISAFTKWLSNTKPDEAARAERLRALDRAEADRKQKELDATPRVSPERMAEIRAKIKGIGKSI